MQRTLAFLTFAFLGAGLAISVFLDWFAGATAISWFSACGVLACGLVGCVGWRLSRMRTVAVATLVVVLGLIALRLVALSPVKPFRTFYGQLEPGMSESAVLSALEGAFPAGGRYAVPVLYPSGDAVRETLGFTLDPNDGRYNSEIIVATFEQGRLKAAEYLPD